MGYTMKRKYTPFNTTRTIGYKLTIVALKSELFVTRDLFDMMDGNDAL